VGYDARMSEGDDDIETLLEEARSSEPSARADAMAGLHDSPVRSDEVRAALLAGLADDAAEVRGEAAAAISTWKDPSFLPPLFEALERARPRTRWYMDQDVVHVLMAIGASAPGDPRAIAKLLEMFDLPDAERVAARGAVRALRAMGPLAAAARPRLEACLGEGPYREASARDVLHAIAPDLALHAPRLVELLTADGPDSPVSGAADQALVAIGEPALPYLAASRTGRAADVTARIHDATKRKQRQAGSGKS
jgi:hypothetical protein